MPTELTNLNASELAAGFRRPDFTPVDVADAVLSRIAATDGDLRAWTRLNPTFRRDAEAAARMFDADRDVPPLLGIPIGVKDVIDTAGLATEGGSRLYAGRIPGVDAMVVSRVTAAGALVVGKTNSHELALGATTPPTRNPLDRNRIPGGSSGGSAAALAARQVPLALGTDTGGSIRIPAAACGVVGLKPTYRAESCAGVIPLAPSLDHVGPMARTVTDLKLLHAVLQPTAATIAVPAAPRVGLVATLLHPCSPGIAEAVTAAAGFLRSAGLTVTELDLPDLAEANETGMTLLLAEALAVHGPAAQQRPELVSPDVESFLATARNLPPDRVAEARRSRTVITDRMRTLMNDFDVLLTPGLVCTPAPYGALPTDPLDLGGETLSVADAHVRTNLLFNLTGQPAGVLPVGLADDGMPAGVQVVGRTGEDAVVLDVMARLEAGCR